MYFEVRTSSCTSFNHDTTMLLSDSYPVIWPWPQVSNWTKKQKFLFSNSLTGRNELFEISVLTIDTVSVVKVDDFENCTCRKFYFLQSRSSAKIFYSLESRN